MIAFAALAGTFAHLVNEATGENELMVVAGWLVKADGLMEPLVFNDSGLDAPRMGTPSALGLRLLEVEGPVSVEVQLVPEQLRGKYAP